jgi:uncharacterized protein YndB with AHSA1/START domain
MSDDVEFEVSDVSEGYTRLELEVVLPGPADEVFSYFVDPRKLEKWWPDEALIDPKPGGKLELSWPMMGWTLTGRFLEVVPVPGGSETKGPAPGSEGKLSFTWSWKHAPELPERTVTIRVVAAEAGDYGPMTHMLLVHGTYDDSDQDQDDRENHFDGWEHFLGKLARVLIDPEGEDSPEDDWDI